MNGFKGRLQLLTIISTLFCVVMWIFPPYEQIHVNNIKTPLYKCSSYDNLSLRNKTSKQNSNSVGGLQNFSFKSKSPHLNHLTHNKDKVILFYNRPVWFGDTSRCSKGIATCPIKTCRCSVKHKDIGQADAIIINAVGLSSKTRPVRSPNQVWILFGLEPPFLYTPVYKHARWRDVFNWTMTYRTDSDIVAPYSTLTRGVGQNDIRNSFGKKKSSKLFTKIALSKSKQAVWLVSKCKTQSRREDYVNALLKYYDVDIYGTCGSDKRKVDDNLPALFKDYRFYLSFENSLCVDYITEKVFKIYDRRLNIIPVVRGGANYSTFLPIGTYINTADFKGPKELSDFLKYLERNVTAYAEILQKKDEYVNGGFEKSMHSAFCDICLKLHDLKSYQNTYNNTAAWLTHNTCTEPSNIH